MEKFENKEQYDKWINSQDWYQTIVLKNGLKTPGRFPTNERFATFEKFDFKGKTVLDVGCNSGQYSFFAKQLGASEVLGIDVLEKRVNQARTIAINEDYDVRFENRGIFDLKDSDGKFDVVLCIAVITEIPDLFGAIGKLKQVIGEYALLELDLAKPLIYLSRSKNWLRGNKFLSRQQSIAEVRYSKTGGWVISPTLDMLKVAFGEEFEVVQEKGGIRYDLVRIRRIKS